MMTPLTPEQTISPQKPSPRTLAEIQKDIIDLLQSLPNINDSIGRQGFIRSANLDKRLFNQIQFDGPTAQFSQLLVSKLVEYGMLDDERDALEAVLEAAKNFVETKKQDTCNQLIQELQGLKQPGTANSYGVPTPFPGPGHASPEQQAAREAIGKLLQQLPARMKDLKMLYWPVASRLKRMQKDGIGDDDEILAQILQQFLANTLNADDFAEMWQASSNPVAINYAALAQRLQRGEMIAALGAEVHHLSGLPFPSERDLAATLAKGAQYDRFEGPLPMIAQYYEMTEYGRGLLVQNVRQAVEPRPELHYSHPLYQFLAAIRAPLLVIAGCYDGLLERYFSAAQKPFVVISHLRIDNVLDKIVLKYWDRPAPEEPCLPEALSPLKLLETYSVIYKVCGCFGLSSPDAAGAADCLTISEEDYFAFARQIDKAMPSYLAKQIGQRSLLFLGHRLRDWQDRLAANAILEKNRSLRGRSFAVQETPTPYESAYWKAHGVDLCQIGLRTFAERLAASAT